MHSYSISKGGDCCGIYVRMHAGNRYDDEVQNDGFSVRENAKDAWFHLKCLKVKRLPKGAWRCATC